jgi:hypothetical protein
MCTAESGAIGQIGQSGKLGSRAIFELRLEPWRHLRSMLARVDRFRLAAPQPCILFLIGATITDGDTGGSDFDVDTAFVRLREVMPQYPPAAMFQLAAEAMCMCIGWSTAGTSPPRKNDASAGHQAATKLLDRNQSTAAAGWQKYL